MAPKDFVVGDWGERRDMAKFQDAYLDPQSGCGLPEQFMTNHIPLVRGPVKYKGQDVIQRDIANFKAGLKAAGLSTEGAWMNAIAPASCARMPNEITRPKRNCCTPAPTRCTKNTRRSSTPA